MPRRHDPSLHCSAEARLAGAFDASVELLSGVDEAGRLGPALQSMLRRYGLQHYAYLAVRLPGSRDVPPLIETSYSPEWLARYREANYYVVDPVIAAAAMALTPVDWADVDKRGASARRLFAEAHAMGVGRHGLTVPIRGIVGELAFFSVTSDVETRDWRAMRSVYMRDMHALAHHVHAAVLRAVSPAGRPTVNLLSPRERKCLELAAAGLTNKAIAREVGISERVVRAYFASARMKLGCRNRGHVLARAVGLGLIHPVLA